jgi:hypothetical protein
MSTSIGILSISSASHGQKVSYTNFTSQSSVIGLIRSFTLVNRDVHLGVTGILVVPWAAKDLPIFSLFVHYQYAKLTLPSAPLLLLRCSSMCMKFPPVENNEDFVVIPM